MDQFSWQSVSEGQVFSAFEAKRRFGALTFVKHAQWKGQQFNLYSSADQHFQYFFMEGPFARGGLTAFVCSKIVAIEYQAMASGDLVDGPVMLRHEDAEHSELILGSDVDGYYQNEVAVLSRASRLPAVQKVKWHDFSSGVYTLALGLVFLNFAHVDVHRFGTALAIGTTCWLGYRVARLQR